jgi:hypothetical protein
MFSSRMFITINFEIKHHKLSIIHKKLKYSNQYCTCSEVKFNFKAILSLDCLSGYLFFSYSSRRYFLYLISIDLNELLIDHLFL